MKNCKTNNTHGLAVTEFSYLLLTVFNTFLKLLFDASIFIQFLFFSGAVMMFKQMVVGVSFVKYYVGLFKYCIVD